MDAEHYPSCSLDARRQARAGLDNIYLPDQAVVRDVIRENSLVNTYLLALVDELANHRFAYQPGQFMMISMPHLGEAPISFSSNPDENSATFALTIRNSGSLTSAVHTLQSGDIIGVRGPYGNGFSLEMFSAKKLVVMAGGIGLAPLRPVLEMLLARGACKQISLLYGCRTPDDFCFQYDYERWQSMGLDLHLTVDAPVNGWSGNVGLVTGLLDRLTLDNDTVALICGPGIMIRFAIEHLQHRGISAENIVTTLERHMKCGVGICGHCHSGGRLVCIDGPVFTADQLPEPENP